MKTVWIFKTTSPHGTSLSAHATQGLAEKALADFVREWWSDVFDEPAPETITAQHVSRYFKASGEEDYEIIDLTINQ